jgi:hypothetical protein
VIALLLAALLAITDPVGDAAGDGSLRPPTTDVYAGSANFDLHGVGLVEGPSLVLEIVLGALDNPGDLANGFSHPVIEVYLDSREGGERELLAGSGMALPADRGWETALRITGDHAELHHLSAQGDRVLLPVDVRVVDGTLIATTPLPAVDPETSTLFAVVGVYDPFSDTGWRDLSREPSPWAFWSLTQVFPVVDLLAPSDEAQRRALQSGTLPLNVTEPDRSGVPWLLMMALGVVVAVVGLGLRSRVAPSARGEAAFAPVATDSVGTLPSSDSSPAALPTGPPAIAPDGAERPGSAVAESNALVGPPDDAPDAEVPKEDRDLSQPETSAATQAEATADRGADGSGRERPSVEPGRDAGGADDASDDTKVPTFVIGRSGRGTAPTPAAGVPYAATDPTVSPPSAALDANSDPASPTDGGDTSTPAPSDAGEVGGSSSPTALPATAGPVAPLTGEPRSGDGQRAQDELEAEGRLDTGSDDPTAGDSDLLGSAWDGEDGHERPDRRWASAWGDDEPKDGSGG